MSVIKLTYPFENTQANFNGESSHPNFDTVKFSLKSINTNSAMVTEAQNVSSNSNTQVSTDQLFEAAKKQVEIELKLLENILSGKNDELNFEQQITEGISYGEKDNNTPLWIYLPLKPIAFNYSHTWEQKTSQEASLGKNALRSLVSKGVKSIYSAAGNYLSEKLGSDFDLNSYRDTALSSIGLYNAETKRSFFGGSEFGDLTFTWTFSPRNPEEAKRIYAIINIFKFASLPQTKSSETQQLNGINKLGRQPYIWAITFKCNVSKNDGINFYKKLLMGYEREGESSIQNNETSIGMLRSMVLKQCNISYGEQGDEFISTLPSPDNDDFLFIKKITLSLTFGKYFNIRSAERETGYPDIQAILNDVGLNNAI